LPENIIRRDKLPAVTGFSVDRIKQLVAEGKFPRPIKIGARAVGWLESEIAAWQQERIAARDALPKRKAA
jgi:prophage regulatory protein